MNTILLLGKNGQVGWELARSLQPLGRIVACSRAEADLSVPESLRELVRDIRPNVIVNAAAYTAVDQAEQEESLAFRVNADGPAVLAESAKLIDALLIHYSTDYVFDGRNGPYRETDPTNPLNVYGRSKRAGEEAIEQSGCRHLIFRTSWVFSTRGKNFLKTILRLAAEREVLRVVDDQIGAPTWARTIAEVTTRILADCERTCPSGIYHLASQGETSWYGFARYIIQQTSPMRSKQPQIPPIPSRDYPQLAPRPLDSRLDCSKLVNAAGIQLPNWEAATQTCLAYSHQRNFNTERADSPDR